MEANTVLLQVTDQMRFRIAQQDLAPASLNEHSSLSYSFTPSPSSLGPSSTPSSSSLGSSSTPSPSFVIPSSTPSPSFVIPSSTPSPSSLVSNFSPPPSSFISSPTSSLSFIPAISSPSPFLIAVNSSTPSPPTSSVAAPPPTGTSRVRKPYLPPCKVCGGKASGLHYCVNTCHGCRMFFRRMLQCSSPPDCQMNKECVIEYRTVRTACAACRYHRCLAVGMKINDKKVGRYSHARRTHNIEEVQQLQLRLQVMSGDHHLLSATEREAQLDLLSERLTSVFVKKHHNTPEYIAKIPHLEQWYSDMRNMQDKLIGPMAPLTYEEYRSVFYSTGLDVDCRRQYIARMFPVIHMASKEMYTFAKAIPGFVKLPIEDQAALYRACIPADDLVNAYHVYDADRQLWTHGYLPHRMQDIATYHTQHMLHLVMEAFVGLQNLDLTLEERAALNAYVIVNADAGISSEGRRLLLPITDTINDLLYRTVQSNHDDPDAFFCKLISALLRVTAAAKVMLEEYESTYWQYEDVGWPYQAKIMFGNESFDKMVDEFQQMCKIMDSETPSHVATS